MNFNRIYPTRARRKTFLLLVLLLTGSWASAQILVKGNVYGGCELGKVSEDASVTINDGTTTTKGSVYGGGRGVSYDEETGWVKGNTTVTMTNGMVERSIYGGGELGSVGDFTEYYTTATNGHFVGEPKTCKPGTGQTTVILTGGQVGLSSTKMPSPTNPDDDFGYVFAGGRGDVDSITNNNPEYDPILNPSATFINKANLLSVCNNSRLEISGNAIITASAYGGSESGLVMSDTYVKMTGGQIGIGYHGNDVWDEDGYLSPEWETKWNTAKTKIQAGTLTDADVTSLGFHACDSWPFTAPYDVYDPNYGQTYNGQTYEPENSNATQGYNGHTYFGNLFGGGSGFLPAAPGVWRRSAGRVWGNVVVDIEGGHILSSVYGGNETTDVIGKTTINMKGGTVGVPRTHADIQARPTICYLYGAGKGDQRTWANQWTNVNNVEVNITGGFIFGSVYGGGEDGHVINGVNLNINQTDGTTVIGTWGDTYYDGNVFGGGRGFTGTARTAGVVCGDINLTISNGTMLGSVYGGGRLASVGTYLATPTSSLYGTMQEDAGGVTHGHITVNINGGTIGNSYEYTYDPNQIIEHTFGGNVYGGCMGTITQLGYTLLNPEWQYLGMAKSTEVNIGNNAIIKSSVYGGGEYGKITTDTEINLSGGTIGTAIMNGSTPAYYLGSVYGGGMGSDGKEGTGGYTATENDLIKKFAGVVLGNTYVGMSAGLVNANIYGGGELASVGHFTYATDGHPTSCEDNTGLATVEVSGGKVGVENAPNDLIGTMGHVFGAGLGYGGTKYLNATFVDNTLVNISSTASVYGSVFGGGQNGHVLHNTDVAVSGNPVIGRPGWGGAQNGNVYGSGSGLDVSHNANHAYSPTAGRVYGNTNVLISGGTIYHSVYGGGALASVGTFNIEDKSNDATCYNDPAYITNITAETGKATVYITGGTIGYTNTSNNTVFGMVYGSGRGDIAEPGDIHDRLAWVMDSHVVIGDTVNTGTPPVILGSVYGSGENGHVQKNAYMRVHSGTIGCTPGVYNTYSASNKENMFSFQGNVYGAGCGTDKYKSNPSGTADTYNALGGIVRGNAKVNITGGYISRNVYGAGAMASVGTVTGTVTHTDANIATESALSCPYEFTYATNTGTASVNVTGGHIGTVAASDLSGDVYGSARGEAGDRYVFGTLANVNNANVTINFTPTSTTIADNTANCIVGSVYGSGENGHVYNNTNVTLTNGLIGGSLFGGGKGTDTYPDYLYDPNTGAQQSTTTQVHSITAGKVYGNTNVTIDDGTVLHNVYGGGNLASVGKGNYIGYGEVTNSTSGPDPDDVTSGICTVTINGGTVGTDGIDNGGVYGSSKGITFETIQATPRYLYSRDFFLGYVNKTNVIIGNNTAGPQINGSVFGGGDDGHVRFNTAVTINNGDVGVDYDSNLGLTADQWALRGNVYGAGRGINFIPGTTEYCPSAGSVTLNTYVNVNGGTVHHNVYGGGSLASVGPPPTGYDAGTSLCQVDINGGTIGEDGFGGNVFGAGRGILVSSNDDAVITDFLDGHATSVNTIVNTTGTGTIYGSVYGGGEFGLVKEDTRVNIGGITVKNNVFGGGKGDNHSRHYARVKRNATTTMTNGTVEGSVYGGGEMASVGIFPVSNTGIISWDDSNNGGTTTVNVTGGQIGTPTHYIIDQFTPTTAYPTMASWFNDTEHNHLARTDVGHVYGAGKGEIDINDHNHYRLFCNVNKTNVTIGTSGQTTGGPMIYGSVYGGSANAHVLDGTTVTVHSGNIGTKALSSWDGHVFGGGEGNNTNHTAGRVGGDISITMDGGTLQGSVYGGGRLGITGVDQFGEFIDKDHGNVTVEISGGTLGNSNVEELLDSDFSIGDVFGSGRGDVDNYADVAAGRVTNTEVTVKGDATVHGCVFGGGEMASIGYWTTSGTGTSAKTQYIANTGSSTVVIGGNANTDNPTIGSTGEYNYTMTNNPGQWTIYDENQGTAEYGRLIHTCTGNVFGAGQGDVDVTCPKWVSMARTRTATVTVHSGTIMSTVFGGGEQGAVNGDTRVTINGGTIGTYVNQGSGATTPYYFGHVYGAGYGSDDPTENNSTVANDSTAYRGTLNLSATPAIMAGRVYGNSRVDINGGEIRGSIFGGASMANVGYELNSSQGNTQVNIGADAVAPSTEYTGSANLKNCDVYGANNHSGTPFGNVRVDVYKTYRSETDEYDYVPGPSGPATYAISNVFGGGNKASTQPYIPAGGKPSTTKKATVEIHGCENTAEYVYGGGNAAYVQGVSTTIWGGRYDYVFGGGNGIVTAANIGEGGIELTLHGGTVNHYFGGSNTNGQNAGETILLVDNIPPCGENTITEIEEFFCGGNFANITGNVISTIECGSSLANVLIKNLYGGCNLAYIEGNVVLTVRGGRYYNIYGGSKGDNTHLAEIRDNPNTPEIEGNITLNIQGGKVGDPLAATPIIGNIFGGSNVNSNVTGKITVNIEGTQEGDCALDLSYANVFGGNNISLYSPTDGNATPEVNVKHGTVLNVFGGSKGDNSTATSGTINCSPEVNIGDGVSNHAAVVLGNVYGGGESATVNGDTHLNFIGNARVDGDVFGGGHNGIITGSTDVKVGAYKISASTNQNNRGSVAGAGGYKPGDSCTLTATANTGYQFVNWTTTNGTVVSTEAAYSFTVTGNASYIANFETTSQP